MKKKSRQAQPGGISFAILKRSIIQSVYNVSFIPHCRLAHRIAKFLQVFLIIRLRDRDATLRVLTVGVATCQVENTKGAVCLVVCHVALSFADLHGAGEVRGQDPQGRNCFEWRQRQRRSPFGLVAMWWRRRCNHICCWRLLMIRPQK